MFTIAKTFIMAVMQTAVEWFSRTWRNIRNRARAWWWGYTRQWDEDDYPW